MLEKLKGLFGAAIAGGGIRILSPVDGEAVPTSEVPDPTFSEDMIGKGMAVIPTSGRIVSPVEGKVMGVFKTCHALTLRSSDGVELLIHVGLDTVKLGGEHLTAHVKKGDMVKPGDLLIELDIDAVQALGYNVITPVLVCNPDDFAAVEGKRGKVAAGDTLITLRPKL